MIKEELIEKLNAPYKEQRISAVKGLKALIDRGEISVPRSAGYTNNHVHTTYSFSPYSPSKAVWTAIFSGLSIVGIIDHDAINGAEEFIEAGIILGIPTTIGFEIRTDWSQTKLAGRRINNPDQLSSGYICAHGLPHTQIKKADDFLSRIRSAREKRNRTIMDHINRITAPYGILIDYDADVLTISCAEYGGEVTERHLLFALSDKLIKKFGKGAPLCAFVSDQLGIPLNEKQTGYLDDEESDVYEYDLLNILKGGFVSRIYIDAAIEETPPVKETVEFIRSCGAIPSYCYLGDIGASPTGDKKAQKFEDDYLEELFAECRKTGFQAIAYMPSRNTLPQLERVMALCDQYGFMQISGEDINQPRQSFICKQLKDPRFSHLIDTTWALVGHEKAATENMNAGMFADGKVLDRRQMIERIEKYKKIGMSEEIK